MSSQALAVVLLAVGLSLIVVIGIRSVRGEFAGFYRISTVCLAIGLNFNTTESVTGDAMSEFGAFCLFVGIFVGIVLVFVDAFSALRKRLAERNEACVAFPNDSHTLPPGDDSVPNGM